MSIQSITANAQPTPAVQSVGNKAAILPETRNGGGLPPESVKQALSQSDSGASNQGSQEKLVKEAVENIQKFVAQSTNDITFSIDQDAGFMVKIIDRTSNDVIRQIPSEEVVAIARALDKLQGLFVKDKI